MESDSDEEFDPRRHRHRRGRGRGRQSQAALRSTDYVRYRSRSLGAAGGNWSSQQEIVEDVELELEQPEDGGGEGGEELDLNALKEEVFLKLLVLGDLGVGKSTLVRRYTGDHEEAREGRAGAGAGGGAPGAAAADYRVSVGTNLSVKRVELDGKSVSIQLWDVPGHERFGGLTRTLYKYAHGAIIVFDLSRPDTFEAALSWLTDVTEKLFDERQQRESQQHRQQQQQQGAATARDGGHSSEDLMPVILLANKCDLPDLKVPRNKYSTFVTENGLLAWYETSAHDPSCGVALAIRRLVEFVLENDASIKVANENAMIWRQPPPPPQ